MKRVVKMGGFISVQFSFWKLLFYGSSTNGGGKNKMKSSS